MPLKSSKIYELRVIILFNLDTGFYFGIGAFETIMVKNSIPLLCDKHLTRLAKALNFLQIEQILSEQDVLNYLSDNKISEGVLKITVSEKNIIYSIRKNTYTKERYEKGFDLCFADFARNESSPLTYHKTINYAENIIARHTFEKNKCDEVCFLNTKGNICEGSFTNIFFINDKEICTPKIESGILPGVMRSVILSNENINQINIKPCDLVNFDECFITNSVMGIMKVNSIDKYCFNNNKTVQTLQEKYKSYF